MARDRNVNLVKQVAAEYARHKAWRMAGRPPTKCPKPSPGDVIDAYLDRCRIVDRKERDKLFCEIANDALNIAEPDRLQPPRIQPRGSDGPDPLPLDEMVPRQVKPVIREKLRETHTGKDATGSPEITLPRKKTLAEKLMDIDEEE